VEATFENVMTFAIENEKAAVELYEMMKDTAKEKSAKVMFGELAAEELKHRRFLEGVTGENVPDVQLKEVTDLKISDYLVDVEFKPDMEYQNILIMAMKREESAVKLYNDMAAQIEDPKLGKLLKFMAQEEAKHKLRLETEYDEKVLAED